MPSIQRELCFRLGAGKVVELGEFDDFSRADPLNDVVTILILVANDNLGDVIAERQKSLAL